MTLMNDANNNDGLNAARHDGNDALTLPMNETLVSICYKPNLPNLPSLPQPFPTFRDELWPKGIDQADWLTYLLPQQLSSMLAQANF
ncbi:hypothetical protein ACLKA6_003171 [Drosophila palustris]